ncbi:MAG: hypothetical protein U1C19_07785 [Methanobacteriaceae archaeon]|nr:hypothetical protein [Methanobacteriaceae archaeon]
MTIKNISSFKMTKALLPVLLLTLVLVFAVGIGDVSAAPGDTIYVNDTGGDDDNDGSDWSTAKKTIKNATGSVNVNGIVNIANGQYSGTSNTGITIDKNMTINGESQTGTIINGTGINWIFHVNQGINFTLRNLTITNATRDYGGAINNDGNLSVTGCSFTSNTAQDYGGAIYHESGILSVIDCSFTGNTANRGGAIINYGSASVTDSSFTGNTANHGGAISNGAILSVTDSSFTSNSAISYGGAIYNGAILSVTGCSFTGNTANRGGAIINYDSLSVTGCSLMGNTAQYSGGVIYNVNDGGSVTANFNRIVNNSPTAIHNGDGSFDAEYNWWGSNNPDFTTLIVGNVDYNPWLYMTLQSNPNTIVQGKTSTLTASFNNAFDGTTVTPLNPVDGHIPEKTPVTFNTDLGSVGSKTINKETKDGVATATLTADETAGIAHVNAVTDSQTVNANVTINPKSSLYLTITPSKNNPMVGETVVYTLKVGNKGPNTAENVVMTYTIPQGLEFAGAQVDVGTYTYDPKTRTITWTIGDVPLGDPYMWLSLKVTSAGRYLINPLLSTSTYDPTLNSNTQSLTVNAAATPNNNNNTVNAATNTVSMQETGIPLILLIMALFMVIGGLVSNKN